MIYMAMRTGTHLWHVAQQGKDDAYDRYLQFRRLLEDEREKARHDSDTLAQADCVLKAKETIEQKAKEGGYDVLEDLEMASKKLVYRQLDPFPEKRIVTPWYLKERMVWQHQDLSAWTSRLPLTLTLYNNISIIPLFTWF